MRVLHVIPSISPHHGGPSFAIRTMVRGLAEKGVEIDVATTDDDGPGRRLNIPLQEPVERDGGHYFFFRKETELYKTARGLRSWLEQQLCHYEIIHIHALFSYSSTIAARIARRKKLPYIVRPLGVLNRWGMLSRRRYLKAMSFRLLERRLLSSASALHFTTERERREAQNLGLRCRSFVIPIGVDFHSSDSTTQPEPFFTIWPQLRCRPIVLFLSRIDPTKNLELLIDAVHLAVKTNPAIALVVAGDGNKTFTTTLRQKIDHLGLNDHVFWTGFLLGEAKQNAFAAARVFVLPSHSESFGIAAVEALATGVPVIITREVGVAEELEQGQAAIVIRPECEQLSDAILRVIENRPLAQQLATNGRRLARERFSIEAMCRNILNMYENCLDQPLDGRCR